MEIVLKHSLYPIKNGFAANSTELGLTAHGHTPELAKQNLARLAALFFQPFERQGKLMEEVIFLKLKTGKNSEELKVIIAE